MSGTDRHPPPSGLPRPATLSPAMCRNRNALLVGARRALNSRAVFVDRTLERVRYAAFYHI